MSLADFKAIAGSWCPPVLVYFHENQLTYPVAPGEIMDLQFGFTDITTALAADRVLFNSKSHYNAFFSTVPEFLRKMPEFRPHWVVDCIRQKAAVLYPGCQFSPQIRVDDWSCSSPPLIIWNHRWEFDKNPGAFFDALDTLLNHGIDFRLALLGENFQTVPKEFIAAREKYKDNIIQYGYVKDKKEYFEWLHRGDIVISTAEQENFGIAMIEAVRYGCFPLLPNRLVYPEIIPDSFHKVVLYDGQRDLKEKLFTVINNYSALRTKMKTLSEAMARFAWERVIDDYDEQLDHLIGS
jgi:glycosyltransferase involved in cell wall biosynthesis